jgi:excisionase family DNA binding protein
MAQTAYAEGALFLTPAEVATTLAVSSRTIRRLVERGDLRGIRVGDQLRIPEDGLREYLDSAREGQAP